MSLKRFLLSDPTVAPSTRHCQYHNPLIRCNMVQTTPTDVVESIADEIMVLAPNLSFEDSKDLLKLKPKQMRDVLGDYLAAKKLNKPQLNAIIKFFRSLAKFAEMAGAIATLV